MRGLLCRRVPLWNIVSPLILRACLIFTGEADVFQLAGGIGELTLRQNRIVVSEVAEIGSEQS